MTNPVEQFTAPGKYEYELAMEELEIALNNSTQLYNNLNASEKDCKINNHYNNSFKMWEK